MIRATGAKQLSNVVLALIGVLALGLAGLRFYQRQLRLDPPGQTAGGAATTIDMCRRGTPSDVAAACIAEQERIDRASQYVIWKWGVIGIVSLLTAAILSWRRAQKGAASGGST